MSRLYCFCGAQHWGETEWSDLGPNCWPVGEREAKKVYGEVVEIPIHIKEEGDEMYIYLGSSKFEIPFYGRWEIAQFFGPIGEGSYIMELELLEKYDAEFFEEDKERYDKPYNVLFRWIKTCCDECTGGMKEPVLKRFGYGYLPLFGYGHLLEEGWYSIKIRPLK